MITLWKWLIRIQTITAFAASFFLLAAFAGQYFGVPLPVDPSVCDKIGLGFGFVCIAIGIGSSYSKEKVEHPGRVGEFALVLFLIVLLISYFPMWL